jgi:hypothetical protein
VPVAASSPTRSRTGSVKSSERLLSGQYLDFSLPVDNYYHNASPSLSRTSSVGQDDLVVKQAWLDKKGGGMLSQWNKRYFVLTLDQFVYYRSRSMMDRKHRSVTITLFSDSVVEPSEAKKYCFSVRPYPQHGREWVLCADSSTERDAWIAKIKSTCLHLAPSESVTRPPKNVIRPFPRTQTSTLATTSRWQPMPRVLFALTVQNAVRPSVRAAHAAPLRATAVSMGGRVCVHAKASLTSP